MSTKNILLVASIMGALAVTLGAFGAHFIQFVNEKAEGNYQLGVTYQYYHCLALLATGLWQLQLKEKSRILGYAAISFMVGTIFFSGSLYLIANRVYLGIEQFTFIYGPMTPLGGLLLILGWIFLSIQAFRSE